MERKVPFEVGEYYHIYTRGVEKRTVFTDTQDSERFLSLLLTCNDERGVKISNLKPSQRGFPSLIQRPRTPIVDICAYALMPNHIHLVLREHQVGGISRFMLKVMTGYSMYFNTRFQRSGPLFTRPFRSKHIDSDQYLQWVFAYILLNPLDLFDHAWRARGSDIKKGAQHFMDSYRYSSYRDYFGEDRPESLIVNKGSLPFSTEIRQIDDLLNALSMYAPEDPDSRQFSSHSLI